MFNDCLASALCSDWLRLRLSLHILSSFLLNVTIGFVRVTLHPIHIIVFHFMSIIIQRFLASIPITLLLIV